MILERSLRDGGKRRAGGDGLGLPVWNVSEHNRPLGDAIGVRASRRAGGDPWSSA